MNIISLLIGLVVLGIALALLYRILRKILPLFGLDAEWTSIVFGIIGLILLVLFLGMFGYGPSWLVLR